MKSINKQLEPTENFKEIKLNKNSAFIEDYDNKKSINTRELNSITSTNTATSTSKKFVANTTSSSTVQIGYELINAITETTYADLIAIKATTFNSYGMGKIVFGRSSDYSSGDQDSLIKIYNTYQNNDNTLMVAIDSNSGWNFQAWPIASTGTITTTNAIRGGSYKSSDGSTGATGSFTTVDSKTITVKNGIITAIV